MLLKKNKLFEQLILYYIFIFLIIGTPFSKIVIIKTFYLFILYFTLLFFSYLNSNKSKFYQDNFLKIYLVMIFFLIFKFNFSTFNNLQQLKVSFIFLVPVISFFIKHSLMFNKSLYFKLSNFVQRKQILIFIYFNLLTIIGRAGSFGFIYFSTPFIDGNFYDIKPQFIVIILFLILNILDFKVSNISLFLLTFNFLLLSTINRSSIIVISFIIFTMIKKKYYTNAFKILIISIFLLLSNSIDLVGYLSNKYIIDSGGKEHFTIACNRYFNKDINIYSNSPDQVIFKNKYIQSYKLRDVELGTMPRFFSANSLLNYIGINLKNKNYLTIGQNNFCENYLNSGENNIKQQEITKQQEFSDRQINANVNFRIELWKYILSNSAGNEIFFGRTIDQNFIKEYSTRLALEIGLWHGHNSWVTIYGYYGIFGLLLFLILLFYNFYKNNFVFILLVMFVQSFIDGIFETPVFSILFWTLHGLGSNKDFIDK